MMNMLKVDGNAVAAARSAVREPIAIIGLGCRLPGNANDWKSFWQLLETGTDAIQETPADRWNLKKFFCSGEALPGKTQSRWGGYVQQLDQFDPEFFGISPREAAAMDPQQRLLLETSYRAIEDAGIPCNRLVGQPVAVFVGISSFDYAVAGLSAQDRGVINTYSNTGGASSIAANRISYCFDLRGPSVSIDTACSSSLVAVHLACESIWRGESSMALAGGVNALILPDFYVAFSQLGVLSPDGRCRAFDSRANGYVRSEGAGVVVLKPLAEALRDRDPIYAVIRGTAVNQDGRTPGMTVPSRSAQESLIRAACRSAGIEPYQLQYVEAHGTGTAVGDPIEAAAIGAVVSQGRGASERCWIGSVKTNIGHLEAGAGVASLIKVALALHHRRLPKHLHFENANPAIDLEGLGLQIPLETQDWKAHQSRLAGINGFGYGGTNAHVILEQAPDGADCIFSTTPSRTAIKPQSGLHNGTEATVATPPVLLPLSARSTGGLMQVLSQMKDWLAGCGSDYHLAEIAAFLAHRRSHNDFRLAICAGDHAAMDAHLQQLTDDSEMIRHTQASPDAVAKGPAMICCGQGPQWWAMGRQLLKASPTFRSAIQRCENQFSRWGDWSLIEELQRNEKESRMSQTRIAQPSIFAIQIGLAEVWSSWGIRPAVLVGHSVGEIAAAHLSGGLSFEDACRVAFYRGQTMDLATSQGAMIAVGLSPEELSPWIDGIEDLVAVAAINGPTNITVSGAAAAIERLATKLEERQIFCRRLSVEYAFHSPQMEPVQSALLDTLATIQPQATHTPLISTVTGNMIEGQQLGGEYWWQNVRQSVRFADAMRELARSGFEIAIELGPHPVLSYSISECYQEAGHRVHIIPSLNREQNDLESITQGLGRAFALGLDINWDGFYSQPSRRIPVPIYPFKKQPLWVESFESQRSRQIQPDHPLLGERSDRAIPTWNQRVDLKLHSYLADHRVRGSVIYPAAALLETAIAASVCLKQQAESSLQNGIRLENFKLLHPCMLSDEGSLWFETCSHDRLNQLTVDYRSGKPQGPLEDAKWIRLVSTQVGTEPIDGSHSLAAEQRLQEARQRCNREFDSQQLYTYCDRLGLHYGTGFQGVSSGWRWAGESVVQVRLPKAVNGRDYFLHPSLLDSCFHAMIAADPYFDHALDGLYLPAEIGEVSVAGQFLDQWRGSSSCVGEQALSDSRSDGCPQDALLEAVTVHARIVKKNSKKMWCDVDIFTRDGRWIIGLKSFESHRVVSPSTLERTSQLIYANRWENAPLSPPEVNSSSKIPGSGWLIFLDQHGIGSQLASRLRSQGATVYTVHPTIQQKQVLGQDESGSQHKEKSWGVMEQNEEYLDTLSIDVASPESYGDLIAQISDREIQRVIYLWGLDAPRNEWLDAESLKQSARLTTLAPLYLVQAIEKYETSPLAHLAIVTRGAQAQTCTPDSGGPNQIAQGSLIGFGRVVISEIARLRTKLIDLPESVEPSDIDLLIDAIVADDQEDEVMLRQGQRLVQRFDPCMDRPLPQEAAIQLPIQLAADAAAGIGGLRYETKARGDLPEGHVEIEVQAAGLNFSDVMKALDLYPGLEEARPLLGAECSGRVVRTGINSRWSVGQEVVAVAPGSFSSHVIVRDSLVVKKPSNLTFEQAAALPIAFLTAHYAIHECARMRAGESLLIHAASGGVGLAALQLARTAGLQILATAGSPEKREYLQGLGLENVMDSRTLAFGKQTLDLTQGAGVDAVLNSLPGPAIPTGLKLLKTGGRFLEIGKRDIYQDSSIGLYTFRNNLSLHAIDLDQLFKQQPERMGQMLEHLMTRFESGELKPLPVQSFPASQTSDAFRLMQQGKHIGKLVVDVRQRPNQVIAGQYDSLKFRTDGTYWIPGGLGGFGMEVAKWLVERGARHLVLSGRSQHLSSEVESQINLLKAKGAKVETLRANITQCQDVSSVLNEIDQRFPPLAGIIHTAMVLEDRLLADLDRETLERVLWPKVLGGWNLHHQTLDRRLDHFIMFSSLSSIFGHAGQGNYSAANAFLDSLVQMRRSCGLPGLVINWGHLGEVGYLAQRAELSQRLERQGILSFSVQQAMDCLEYAMQTQAVQSSVLKIDWSVWRGLGITGRVSPRFSHLLQHPNADSEETLDLTQPGQLKQIRIHPRPKQEELVSAALKNKLASLLGMKSSQMNEERAPLEMGMDSLMAVELRNWIESSFEIHLPISTVMRGRNLRELTQKICESIAQTAESADHSNSATPDTIQRQPKHETVSSADSLATGQQLTEVQAAQLLQNLDQLSGSDVNRLLSQLLSE